MRKNNSVVSAVVIVLCLSIFMYTMPSFSKSVSREIQSIQVESEYTKEMDCLAKNIYYEAGHESFEGKLAVAQVTLNRTKEPEFPSSICGVVYQKKTTDGETVCQFTWTCFKVNTKLDEYTWQEAKYIAHIALTKPTSHDIIKKSNALFYHADYVNPHWNKHGIITKIGHHIFYASI